MMSAVWRDPTPRRRSLPNVARRRSPAVSRRPSDGPGRFQLWMPLSVPPPAISTAPGSSYIGAAVEGLAVGRIISAFARRFGTRRQMPDIISAEALAAELGAWARGYALDQRLSGAKARRDLGWRPKHLDPEGEIAQLP